ncbi:hypothetical protein E2P81_ATG03469 [Venturia nashicola]|nr:hypothetical protein E2P81_ATG03469 [Venturia nashicola]
MMSASKNLNLIDYVFEGSTLNLDVSSLDPSSFTLVSTPVAPKGTISGSAVGKILVGNLLGSFAKYARQMRWCLLCRSDQEVRVGEIKMVYRGLWK